MDEGGVGGGLRGGCDAASREEESPESMNRIV